MWAMFNQPSGIGLLRDQVDHADVAVQLRGAAHLVGSVGPFEAEADPLERFIY